MSDTKSNSKYAGMPACLIERSCACFVLGLYLFLLFPCYAFLLRLNRVHPRTSPRPPNSSTRIQKFLQY